MFGCQCRECERENALVIAAERVAVLAESAARVHGQQPVHAGPDREDRVALIPGQAAVRRHSGRRPRDLRERGALGRGRALVDVRHVVARRQEHQLEQPRLGERELTVLDRRLPDDGAWLRMRSDLGEIGLPFLEAARDDGRDQRRLVVEMPRPCRSSSGT